jgi:ABC-type branched-subunit amino acid transport system ATPase component
MTAASSARPAAMEVVGLTAGYRRQPIVFDIDAAFYNNEITCIVGPNGAGKSTLLKAIFGLIHIMGGAITLDGTPTRFDPAVLVRQRVAYVPQQRNVFPTLTVRENLEMGAYAVGEKSFERVLELFPVLKDILKKQAGKLSVGQRNMLAVARALMAQANILLLDEATGGLAPKVAEDLWEHVVRLAREGDLAIVVVEQNVDLALKHSDKAILLTSGRVALRGSASEFRERPDFESLFIGRDIGDSARPNHT